MENSLKWKLNFIEIVSHIHLNTVEVIIVSFWRSVSGEPERIQLTVSHRVFMENDRKIKGYLRLAKTEGL